MVKARLWLKISIILSSIGRFLHSIANKIESYSVEHHKFNYDVKENIDVVIPGPHPFSTFTEGMASEDYCTRHDAASKLVGWYLYQNGHPLIEELVRAADILLEDTSATVGDISFLVGAWRDQASATTDADREAAVEREDAIYARVAIKVKS